MFPGDYLFYMLKGPVERDLHFRIRGEMGVVLSAYKRDNLQETSLKTRTLHPFLLTDQGITPLHPLLPQKSFFKHQESAERWNKPQQKQFSVNSAHKTMESESGAA
ncbi:hypothetical protein CEXT_480731 [Caerostris extrusa]|uniref:Uncharacterized protein n=1 Tax=Caerostris extrusa TaxID=172846 RepID=A0AAV4T2S0_CAEEX|nr:hypothetical protein CEXT_480731 [Caerostris extrusa]